MKTEKTSENDLKLTISNIIFLLEKQIARSLAKNETALSAETMNAISKLNDLIVLFGSLD